MNTGSYIDGAWYQPSSDRTIKNTNPADTSDVIAEFAAAGADDVQRAVEGAKKAFPAWAATPAPERARVVWRAVEIARGRTEEIAQTMTREQGKVLKESRGEALLRMRRALEEFKIIGIRTNIPFHQLMMDSTRFMAGQYDTRFVEERFSMEAAEEEKEGLDEIAALIATLVAHEETAKAAQIVQRNARDTSNWKWVSRWERMRR